MAFYITFILIGCGFIFIAVKGTEYHNKYFSIPAIAVKSRVYAFIAGALCLILVWLIMSYSDSEEVSAKQVATSTTGQQSESPSSQQSSNPVAHTMKLYCCNTDTGAKVCPIDIAIGTPGFPCYCVGAEGAGIICQ